MKTIKHRPCRACHGTGMQHPLSFRDEVKFAFDSFVSSVFMAVQMASIVCIFAFCIVAFYNFLIFKLAGQ